MFCGYNPLHYKLFIWTLSAVLCGIAGALYVPQVGIINPSEMSPANSIEIAIWVAVGGRGTLIGADHRRRHRQRARRAVFTVAFPEYWLFFLGAAVRRGDAVPAARAWWAWSGRCGRASGRQRHERRPSGRSAALNAGDAGRSATLARGELDASHGVILYLDDITVSFDGFKALNSLSLADRRRRAALHHRPQRRRQDDDDGRHHRQDAARTAARAFFGQIDRPDATDRGRDRARRHRPQVPEADHLRAATACSRTSSWR